MAKPKAMEHTEHMVTDGRDLIAAPFLRGPEDARAAIESLANSISFAWGVPPQVLGESFRHARTKALADHFSRQERQQRATRGIRRNPAARGRR